MKWLLVLSFILTVMPKAAFAQTRERFNSQTRERFTNQPRARFTDQSLQDILVYSELHQTTGVIYTWSPRMVLSFRGVIEIAKLGQELRFDVTFLVDPNLPDSETLSVTENAWLAHSLKADSRILERWGLNLHYPNLILYKNGKIDSIRPGYDEPDRVRDYILRRLQ